MKSLIEVKAPDHTLPRLEAGFAARPLLTLDLRQCRSGDMANTYQ